MDKKLLLIIIALIIVLLFFLALLSFLFSRPNPQNETRCPDVLQVCGRGCIPQNAICCDDGNINSYCLQPTHGCGQENCDHNCPQGQAFCGMFCYPIGRECCFGGKCPTDNNNNNNNNNNNQNNTNSEVNVTLVSAKDIVCIFEKSDLWSPQMPWDGSYICRGSITLNLHGLTFAEGRTLRLDIEPSPEYASFSEYDATANTPINQITFNYSQVGGDYFQKNKPECPVTELKGRLKLFEAVPDIEKPFPTQYFDINVSASCE